MSQTDWDRICQWCQGDMGYDRDDFCCDECRLKYEALDWYEDAEGNRYGLPQAKWPPSDR